MKTVIYKNFQLNHDIVYIPHPRNTFELIITNKVGTRIAVHFIEPLTVTNYSRKDSIFRIKKWTKKELLVLLKEQIKYLKHVI